MLTIWKSNWYSSIKRSTTYQDHFFLYVYDGHGMYYYSTISVSKVWTDPSFLEDCLVGELWQARTSTTEDSSFDKTTPSAKNIVIRIFLFILQSYNLKRIMNITESGQNSELHLWIWRKLKFSVESGEHCKSQSITWREMWNSYQKLDKTVNFLLESVALCELYHRIWRELWTSHQNLERTENINSYHKL